MKRIAASVSAVALALGAVLLAPPAAQADEATATISDPTGDVVRDPGVSKKDTSDVTKFGIAYDKDTVTVTWWFKKLRKGTVKHFEVYLDAVEYGVEYVLLKVPGFGAGLYLSYPSPGDDPLCDAEVDQKKGDGGRYRVSFERSCLTPEGESGKAKTLVGEAVVGIADPYVDWYDEQDAQVVGPAGPLLTM